MYLILLIALASFGSLQNIQCSIMHPGYVQEGFCSGTLVKVADGCKLIENLKVGDCVLDADGRERPIIAVAKRAAHRYMNITVGETVIRAGKDQKFFVSGQDFFTARNLLLDHVLLDVIGRYHCIDHIELVQDKEMFIRVEK